MARPLAWSDTIMNIALVDSVAMTAVNLLANMTASDTITTMRIVGRLRLCRDNLATDVENVTHGAFGIGVAALEAFTANVLPDPEAQEDAPARGWLWRDCAIGCYAKQANQSPALDFPEYRFDIRSSRKVDRGVLYFNGRQSFIGGVAQTWRINGLIRVLCAT